MSVPVSSVAGLVPPVDRSPCRPGSVEVICSTTDVGSSTYSGVPSCSATTASWFSSMKRAASPTVAAGTWIWSYVEPSMKTKSSPSLYRYCMSRLSTFAVSTLVPALKVLSTTLPDSTALSLVRTNAGPLPGLTCWNSTTDQSWPSRFSTMPFFRSFVDATSSLSLPLVGCCSHCSPSPLYRARPGHPIGRAGLRPPQGRPPAADVGAEGRTACPRPGERAREEDPTHRAGGRAGGRRGDQSVRADPRHTGHRRRSP